MNPQAFKNAIAYYHALRLSRSLGLTDQGNSGIDLLGPNLGIELKCQSDRQPPIWPVHHDQVDKYPRQNPDRPIYWGFVLYHLRTPVENIPNGPIHHLGLYVRDSQVWFLPWDWIRTFPVQRPKTGPYVYISSKNIPPLNTFTSQSRLGYRLHLPKDTDLEERLRTQPPQPTTKRVYRIKV